MGLYKELTTLKYTLKFCFLFIGIGELTSIDLFFFETQVGDREHTNLSDLTLAVLQGLTLRQAHFPGTSISELEESRKLILLAQNV